MVKARAWGCWNCLAGFALRKPISKNDCRNGNDGCHQYSQRK